MLKRIIEKNYKWIIAFLCLIIVLMMLEDIFENEQLALDMFVYRLVILNLRTEPLTTFMEIITNLSSSYVLIAITIGIWIFVKNKKVGWCVASNLVITVLLNQLLKYIIQRPRPDGYRLITESGYSFPSGHSMVSMAFYGLIIYLIWKMVKNKKIKYISCGILAILIPMIGFSRIYLGVHYASDVIGGFAISIVYLLLYTNITRSILQLKKEKKNNMKNKGKMIELKRKRKKLRNSFKYAFEGIVEAYKAEQNLKIHFFIMTLVIIAGFIFKISAMEWMVCLLLFAIVISLELVNTAIETTVDIAMPEINEKAKYAKDIAAGAVLFSAIISVIIGLIIFLPKVFG